MVSVVCSCSQNVPGLGKMQVVHLKSSLCPCPSSFVRNSCIIHEASWALSLKAPICTTSAYISWFTLDINRNSLPAVLVICCAVLGYACLKNDIITFYSGQKQTKLFTIAAAVFVVFVRCFFFNLTAKRNQYVGNRKINQFIQKKQENIWGSMCL